MMTTRAVPAAQLHIGDLVLPETAPTRRITLHRLQGTPPVVVLAYAGQLGQQALPSAQRSSSWPAAMKARTDVFGVTLSPEIPLQVADFVDPTAWPDRPT
jgi:hypothetical protein